MDIGNLVTQDNANEGVWFQAVLYGRKQPFDVCILGADSDEVQKKMRDQLRKVKSSMKDGKANFEDIDDETMDELLDSSDDNIVVRMNGLRTHGKDEPLTMCGRELKNDVDSYRYIVEKIPDLKDFILKKSNERLNFLDNGKKN